MTDQLIEQHESWLARNQAATERVNERLAQHAEQPWHVGFVPINNDIMKRLDRIEQSIVSIGNWMIRTLIGILVAISLAGGAVLYLAWRILESKAIP